MDEKKESSGGGCAVVAGIAVVLIISSFIPSFIRGGGSVESGFEGVEDSMSAGAIFLVIGFIAFVGYQIGKGSK